MKREQCS